MNSKRQAFTLVELMVASVIGLFVALVAVGSLRAVSDSAKTLEEYSHATEQLRFAAETLRRDLLNIYRESNSAYTRFAATVDLYEDSVSSRLLFYTTSRKQARPGEPEGDVYEVEYFLVQGEERSALMRRVWPNPNKKTSGGGLLTELAENIVYFKAQYYDGTEWRFDWPEELEQVCDLIEVQMASVAGDKIVTRSFAVNLSEAKMTSRQQEEPGGDGSNRQSNNINQTEQ